MKKLLFLILCPIFLFGQTQVGNDIDGQKSYDAFGSSVSISEDGSIICISSRGKISDGGAGKSFSYVQVYKNESGIWNQIGKDITTYSNYVAVSLSADGKTFTMIAPGNKWGFVRTYNFESGAWKQKGNDITFNEDSTYFDIVDLSSDSSTIALSGIIDNVIHTRVYKYNTSTWEKIGDDIIVEKGAGARRTSISLSSNGNIIAVGNVNDVKNQNSRGSVNIFKNNSSIWTQIGADIIGNNEGDWFGYSVSLSLDGNIVAIGAYFGKYVKVYKNISGNWTLLRNTIISENNNSSFGETVSLSANGEIIAIGAPASDRVIIYKSFNGGWVKFGNDINSEAYSDFSGRSLALSLDGNTVIIGAENNDGNGYSSGHVRVYDLSQIVLSSGEFIPLIFNIYPNPTSKNLNIQLSNSELQNVNIYNNLGQKVLSKKSLEINIENLKSGIYILEVISNTGKSSQKFIVN